MSKPCAIFVDGPNAGHVMAFPGAPEIIAVDYPTVPVARFDASELVSPLGSRRVHYRQAIRQPLPFGYVPYMLETSGPFTSVHADAATRMIELLVEQGHAESTRALVEGYRRTTGLLSRRIEGLERRLTAVMANHGLSDLMDEPVDE